MKMSRFRSSATGAIALALAPFAHEFESLYRTNALEDAARRARKIHQVHVQANQHG